jgi:hypothetical protein
MTADSAKFVEHIHKHSKQEAAAAAAAACDQGQQFSCGVCKGVSFPTQVAYKAHWIKEHSKPPPSSSGSR